MEATLQNLPTTRQVYRRSPNPTNSTSTRRSLSLQSESIPDLSPTSLLILVRAVSLNYRDANILQGTNPWDVASHGIPCSDCAGLVIAAGTKVTRFSVGDRVTPIFDQKSITGHEQDREWLGGEVDGILATHVVFDEEKVVRIPDGLSWAEASLLPCAGVTAWSGLGLGHETMAGKTVLLMGMYYPWWNLNL
jgi:NADPH:quinone reductase-like Zn-dependent oxidoreductase